MSDEVKRYIKFLAVCRNPKLFRAAIASAPESVIKVIANAALNAQSGEIPLKPRDKQLFARQRRTFNILTTKKTSVAAKRKALLQKGGLSIAPIILQTVLSVLGSGLFAALRGREPE